MIVPLLRFIPLSRETKNWLSQDTSPRLSAILPQEFPKRHNAGFIVEKLICHHAANQAIISSVSPRDSLVIGKLKKHIKELITENGHVDSLNAYPPEQDIEALTKEEALVVYDGLLANFINKFASEKNLKKGGAERLMVYTLEEEARFTGYLLKSLDLYDLPRPAELTDLYGDGKISQSGPSDSAALHYWYEKRVESQRISYPKNIEVLGDEISATIRNNFNRYNLIKDEFYYSYSAENEDRPSRPIDDLVHEVNNLILRNIAVDEAVGITPKTPYPSLVNLEDLGKYDLLLLYEKFGENLMQSFQNRDKFQGKSIDWYGKKLTPREFLITTLDHLSLHTGSLLFMMDYFK